MIAPRCSSGVDGELLEGLVQLAVDMLGDDLRLADRELEALAAHLLDEDGQCQLATALDLPRVGASDVEHAQRHVADQLGVQTRLDHAGGELVALDPADERRGVGADDHGDGRLVDGDRRQSHRVLDVGEGVADHDLGDTRDGDDVTGHGDLAGLTVDADGLQQLGDLDVLDAVGVHPRDVLPLAELAVVDADQREATEEVGGVEVGDVGLQRRGGITLGRRHVLHEDVEQHVEVLGVGACPSSGRFIDALPSRPDAYRTGRSSSASAAAAASSSRSDARSRSRSWASVTTSSMRASGRSVLFTTMMTGSDAASALRSTKRVCGSGPSDASTSSTTPSTIDRPRSTSPPKSAWPGCR